LREIGVRNFFPFLRRLCQGLPDNTGSLCEAPKKERSDDLCVRLHVNYIPKDTTIVMTEK
jgi:hypothetical protein